METIEKSIEVNAPVNEVYNQWTQFEDFPRFMEGVQEVRQISDKRLLWKAHLLGKSEEWEAEIYDQVPDERIAWRSVTGAPNTGVVSFQPLEANRTRVNLALSYQPEGAVEKIGEALGLVSSRVEGDLERFRQYIEERGRATGAWRGEIH